jgi:hypothetical protein
MDAITELTQIDYSTVFISVFIILIGIKAIVSVIEWFITKLGLETKRMRKNTEDHELLIKTSESLLELKKRHEKDMIESDRHDEEMRKDIKKLTDMFINKEINDYRWEIINFAARISEGKKCSKESYKHCMHTYTDYEKLLEDHDLTNGEVEISMNIIRESYQEKLKEGF